MQKIEAYEKNSPLAFGQKGFQNDALDNQEIVLKIAQLRYKRAQLLGYETHAHFVLEERMAKTPETVRTFLEDLLKKHYLPPKRNLKNSKILQKTRSHRSFGKMGQCLLL